MAYFEWASDMEIDQGGPIDADHRHLVNLVNALHDATTEGRGREVVGGIIDELVAYTVGHFQREESIMAVAGFPTLDGHKKEHLAFVVKLEELTKRYQEGSVSVAAHLSSFLRDWLSLHIRRSDKKLLEFIEKKKKESRKRAVQSKP